MVTKIWNRKELKFLGLIVWPTFIAAVITFVYYPGFMSFDTIYALESSKTGVIDSAQPPMVTYIWWAVGNISSDPGLMFFLQVCLLLISATLITYLFCANKLASSIFLVFYISIPVILGTITVIWKDVLTAGFLLTGFLLTSIASKCKTKRQRLVLIFAAVIFLFFGICTRHNSISAAIPIYFYISWVVFSTTSFRKISKISATFLFFVLLSLSSYGLKLQLDNYSLPTFSHISGSQDISYAVKALDLAGGSICTGTNLFDGLAPGLTLSQIKEEYDPRHANLSAKLISRLELNSTLDQIWQQEFLSHPFCMTHQKRQLAKFLLGINQGQQFLITDPGISENRLGIVQQASPIRDFLVSTTITNSNLVFVKPWVFFLLSSIILLIVIVNKRVREFLNIPLFSFLTLYISASTYLGGLVLFGNAADARLPFYSTTIFIIILYSVVAKYISKTATIKFNSFSNV